MRVYKLDASPPARSVMMVVDILKAPVELVDLDVIGGKHMEPDYLKKNPLHTIPILEDGDFVLHDSHAIITYLCSRYGAGDALYPRDTQQRALVDQKLYFDTSILFPRLRNITYPAIFEGLRKPTEKQLKDIEEAYGFLESFLSSEEWLAGGRMSLADIAALASVSSLVQLLPLSPHKYPRTAKWLSTMESQPFCKKWNTPGALTLGQVVREKFSSAT